MAQDTGAAKLPALPKVATGNVALDRLLQALCERLEVREGSRGNPFERTLLVRDVAALGFDASRLANARGQSLAGTTALKPLEVLPGGMTADAFGEAIRNTKIYQDLKFALDDPARFGDLPDKVQALLGSIADEAAKRGADVRQLEMALQTLNDSLAYRVSEVTAAVEGAAAGVRQTAFASANANNATAGLINQVQARLDDVGGVTIEESMIATADRVDGLAGEYMVKINAGGAVAGFGLAASEDPSGATESAFVIQADKFALVAPINFSTETTPSATAIGQVWYKPSTKVYSRASATGTGSWAPFTPTAPFGVNTATGQTFINGSLSINSGGAALQDSTAGADGQGVVKGVSFLRALTLPATPTGGSFATPTATSWSDGVPADNNQPLWMTTRLFTSDGLAPQSGVWTTPAKIGTPSTGAKVQFSVDGLTLWHDTPDVADYYLRNGTSTDNGVTWVYSGATKIKGEQGLKGDTGNASTVPGPTGSRGTIVTKITVAFTTTAAYNQINSIATAAGMTPTYPIKGDIVSHPGGAQECSVAGNPGTWVPVAAYINGNLIVDGTISAGLSFSSAGYFSGTGEGAGGTANVAANGAAMAVTYTGMFISTAGTGARAGVIGKVSSSGSGAGVYGESPLSNVDAGGVIGSGFYGVIGKGVGGPGTVGVYGSPLRTNLVTGLVEGTGVQGVGGTSATSIGVHAQAGSAGFALKVTGNSTFSGSIQCDSSINAVGNVTAYGSSDRRLKENIARIPDALQKVAALNGVYFDWTEDYLRAAGGEDGYFVRRHDVGVIAQEVQAVFPEIVAQRPDGTLAVKYDHLVPVLLEAIKELEARLARLEKP